MRNPIRTTSAALFSILVVASAAAETEGIRFLPPNPTSKTAVTARLSGFRPSTAVPRCGKATVTDQMIVVSLDCIPDVGGARPTPWELDVWIGLLPAGIYSVEAVLPHPTLIGAPPPVALARATLTVQEADPAFELSPNVGSDRTPAPVVISGLRSECGDRQLCAQATVRFGESAAFVRRVDAVAGQIEVQPLPGSGTVAVTVEIGSRVLRRVAAFHYFGSTRRPPPEFYMPVLLPVYFAVRGAFGSNWDTEASVRNENDDDFATFYGSPFDIVLCTQCDPPPATPTPPHTTRIVTASRNSRFLFHGLLGSLIYISRQAAPKLDFGLLVRDLSRQSEALGAEIPVVRENDLYDGSFSLLNIPNDDRFRSALRIYSIDKAAVVRLRIRPMTFDTPIVDVQAALPVADIFGQHHGSLAIGDLAAAYPQIRGRGPLRIEISPDSPGDLRLWGFVTVTNNETQHVTVISPQ